MQKYSGSQKLSQIGKFSFFSCIFQYSNFRNKFIIVSYSCVRVVKAKILFIFKDTSKGKSQKDFNSLE
ncbi:hypothetical protein LEP1GSC188_0228 [Leptospira weilii serovar Topaz str. LT2116]|uniref:Uncharacterized protein n=1 Tax=Leptospira weilii serovar Topaz str. LT2116 TaxID=1088540 RepID=M3H023_9LEPT|nr:hypothetical protein LEP1GSC188_0228 [Leptospira weilii serovar Topaz str. LT2116]